MPSYDAAKVNLELSRIHPSMFDEPGNSLNFNCDGYEAKIHTAGKGFLSLAFQNAREQIHIDQVDLNNLPGTLNALRRPESFAVLTMLARRYWEYKRDPTGSNSLQSPIIMFV